MDAIILAAGRGSRLRSLTDLAPKCLVELGEVALIDRAINSLRRGGVSRVTVVAGYRAESLRSRVGAGRIDTMLVNERWDSTNMVASLVLALRQDQIARGQRTIVSYGDIFYEPTIVADLATSDASFAVAYDPHGVDLWTRRFVDPLEDLEDFRLGVDGTITRIGSPVPSTDGVQGQYMGLLGLSSDARRGIQEAVDHIDDARLDMTSLLQRLILSGTTLTGVPNLGRWGEIDSPEDLVFFNRAAGIDV